MKGLEADLRQRSGSNACTRGQLAKPGPKRAFALLDRIVRTVRIAHLKSNSGLLRSLVFFFNVRVVVQSQMNALRFHRKQFQI